MRDASQAAHPAARVYDTSSGMNAAGLVFPAKCLALAYFAVAPVFSSPNHVLTMARKWYIGRAGDDARNDRLAYTVQGLAEMVEVRESRTLAVRDEQSGAECRLMQASGISG